MEYKKIIVCPSGRINLYDTSNNGLLFRNLFKNWPKDKIAQVFNSGDNGDPGFFNNYYQFTEKDRRFGYLYSIINKKNISPNTSNQQSHKSINRPASFILILRKLFIETGLYELIFRPKLSSEFKKWLDDFKPELVLIQGYSLTFTEFPLLIKKYTNAKLIFFTTDDWPKYLYNGNSWEYRLLALLPRMRVNKMVKTLICETDIPIAFGNQMQEEYTRRYNKKFFSLIHSDDPLRFEGIIPLRVVNERTFSIITIGAFNKFRWPLLKDFEECCENLKNSGIEAKITVISNAIDYEGIKLIRKMKHIQILADPGSENILQYLKGADLLLLCESFDEHYAKSIALSISTKAHLYMFSKRPILVYSHSSAGIINYASKFGWAYTVTKRNILELTDIIKELSSNKNMRERLIKTAYEVAMENHNINEIENKLYNILHYD